MEAATPGNETAVPARTRRANDLGPTGARVAENVKALRESLPLTTEQLAERVTAFGRPMRANTITKIEKQQRRVDVDDLMALALALESRPDYLLLPPTVVMEELELVEGMTVTAFYAWRWANGDRPLNLPEGDDGTEFNRFQMRAQPAGLRAWRRSDDGEVVTPRGVTDGERAEEAQR
ncbi:helix-turn-helix domain-containing protein [Streptomyces ardesiacus]